MLWTDWLMLFLIIIPATVVAVILNTNFREGRCIGCGKCGAQTGGRCIFADQRKKPSAKEKHTLTK